jgi:hypothetical protein
MTKVEKRELAVYCRRRKAKWRFRSNLNRKVDPLSGINVFEANAKIPRKVRIDDDIVNAIGFTLFLLALWLIPAAWVGYHDIRDLHIRDTLRREGHEENGEVIKSHPSRDGVNVEYGFAVDGTFYYGRGEITADHSRVQAPGEKIPIRYLPKDPSVNQPVNWGWFSVGWAMFYFIGLGLLVGLGAIVIAGLRKKKLARMGVVVEGKVTGCAPYSDRYTVGSRFTVYYEFTTEDNVWMEGKTQMSEECQAGDSIAVMYLRSNPKRNDFYPE